MNRDHFLKYLLAGSSYMLFPVLARSSAWRELPKVLLIGDSISIGYTPYVKELLTGKAEVFRPLLPDGTAENCQGTTSGVENIDRWIGQTKWDVIHFNFGLHDIKHVDPETGVSSKKEEDPLQADIKQYRENLEYITSRLLSTDSHLIFATTTPVPDGDVSPLREPGNVVKYNKAAIKIMKRHNITINNLYSYTNPLLSDIQIPVNVHFTEDGYRYLAKEVVSCINMFLEGLILNKR